ncbi:MFS general substrate transporter [Suillus paluster]|uniref:MFS general substrate transporter n=1 Tax=Suillus paluster TaxID=48578 RepID=UPI001B8679DF|nr:MFS general substrate transporter [Suillus paluster]KAG1726535.1 MFS general substrate transporter [Suillus paluster]
MSDRPLLVARNYSYSPHYGAPGRSCDDGPALPEQNRTIVEKRLLRKLDLRVAFLILVYIMNFMDRTNIAAARLRGFEEDLGMMGNQFNTLTSILYVGYFLTQAPSYVPAHYPFVAYPRIHIKSNMFLDRMKRPSLYLSSCMAIWGAITVFIGLARTYHTALILRFLIGFVEAAFFPGAAFLLSRWYKRNELELRTALLACGGQVSNAFGALMASGILSGLDGTLGFTGWRWLFFVEGTLTVVVAVSAIWIIPDFPSMPSVWLLSDEQILAKRRMEEEVTTGNKGKPVEGWSGLAEALMDWRVWWLGAVRTLTDASFATVSLLLCAPPWILGTATLFLVARHSDATGDRFWHITGPLLVGIVGFIISISTMHTAVRYLALFFMTQATVASVVLLTWVMNTFSQSQSKRAAAIALINSMSAFGYIGVPYFWPSSWGPSYVNSYLICILTSIMPIIMCWIFREHLSRCNEAAEAEERALGLSKGFRYLL